MNHRQTKQWISKNYSSIEYEVKQLTEHHTLLVNQIQHKLNIALDQLIRLKKFRDQDHTKDIFVKKSDRELMDAIQACKQGLEQIDSLKSTGSLDFDYNEPPALEDILGLSGNKN